MTCGSKRVMLKLPRLRHRRSRLHLMYRPSERLAAAGVGLFTKHELQLIKNTQMLAQMASNPRSMDAGSPRSPEKEVNRMAWQLRARRRPKPPPRQTDSADKENRTSPGLQFKAAPPTLPTMERDAEWIAAPRQSNLVGIMQLSEEQQPAAPQAPKKKLSRKQREKIEREAIEQHRQKMLAQANLECEQYRRSSKMDEEQPKPRKISFNQKKEVLEFNKAVTTPRRLSRDKEQPPKSYEIKSVLKGSQGVYSGQVSAKRQTYLGNKINLYNDEISEVSGHLESTVSAKLQTQE